MPFPQSQINFLINALRGQGIIPETEAEVKIDKGQPNGYAGLDSDGKVPAAQLPDPPAPTFELVSAFLTSTQGNNTVTPAVLTGHTFTVSPGEVLTLSGQVVCTSAATTTGFAVGVRVAQAAGADANAIGSAGIQVALSNAAAASALYDADVFDVAANTNTYFEVLGTATTAGNNGASYQVSVKNLATTGDTTVTIEFRSEGPVLVTAQIGTGCSGIVGA